MNWCGCVVENDKHCQNIERQRIENKIECRFMSFVTQRPHSFFLLLLLLRSSLLRLLDKVSMERQLLVNIFSTWKIHLFCPSACLSEQMEQRRPSPIKDVAADAVRVFFSSNLFIAWRWDMFGCSRKITLYLPVVRSISSDLWNYKMNNESPLMAITLIPTRWKHREKKHIPTQT